MMPTDGTLFVTRDEFRQIADAHRRGVLAELASRTEPGPAHLQAFLQDVAGITGLDPAVLLGRHFALTLLEPGQMPSERIIWETDQRARQ